MIDDLGIGVLANICFKILQEGSGKLISKLRKPISESLCSNASEKELDDLCKVLSNCDINEDMSAKGIEKILAKNDELNKILSGLKSPPVSKTQIISQNNVFGNNEVGNVSM